MERNNLIKDLVNKKPLNILKFMYQYEPDMVKEQINTLDSNGNTLLMSLIANRNLNTQDEKEIYDFLTNIGYNLKKSNYNNNGISMPEYLKIANGLATDVGLSYMTEQLGKDYILELYNQYRDKHDIVNMAFERGNLQTLRIYQKMGLDLNLVEDDVIGSKSNYQLACKNVETLSLYWELKKLSSSYNEDEEFQKDIKWISEKINRVESRKVEYEYRDIYKYIKEKFEKYTQDQKEKVLLQTLACNNEGLTTEVLRLLKVSFDKYESVENPMWKSISLIKNQNFIYRLIKKGLNFTETHNDEYSVIKFLEFLNKQRINEKGDARDAKMNNIMQEYFTQDFLTSKVPNKNYTYFSVITEQNPNESNRNMVRIPSPLPDKLLIEVKDDGQIMNIERNIIELNQQEIINIEKILNNTWLDKNSKGEYVIVSSIRENGFYDSWVLDKLIIEAGILSNEQMEKILDAFFNSEVSLRSTQVLTHDKKISDFIAPLYEYMKKNEDINWNNVNVPELYDNEEIGFEIKAMKQYYNLQKKIPVNEISAKKNKI